RGRRRGKTHLACPLRQAISNDRSRLGALRRFPTRLALARDPNRKTVQQRAECREASARRGKRKCIDSRSQSKGNRRAALPRANAADRWTIRREVAPRPETYELAAAVVRTL